MMIKCTICKITKAKSLFSPSKINRIAHRYQCKECVAIAAKEWRLRNPDKVKEFTRKNKRRAKDQLLKRLFGITIEHYDDLLAKQKGLCAICHSPPSYRSLAVDHCHKTGKVRSLLCTSCNTALGSLKEDVSRCYALAKYIIAHLPD